MFPVAPRGMTARVTEMERLTDEYIASCPRDGGIVLRGHNMTRIESFVDAAFAFALTLLVISIDQIPRSPAQLVETARDIPAFLISAWMIGQLWLAHVSWSRIFGLQDRLTVILSLALVMLVLTFVYPLKLMFQAGIFYFSGGTLGANIMVDDGEWTEVAVSNMFAFAAAGVLCLALVVIALYLNGLRFREELRLNAQEVYLCWRRIFIASVVGVTAIACAAASRFLTGEALPWAGMGYLSLFVSLPLASRVFRRFHPPPASRDSD